VNHTVVSANPGDAGNSIGLYKWHHDTDQMNRFDDIS
jgi:hypothetical protein